MRNGLSRCGASTSSVLFNSNVPTFTGLDGNIWASQLLTLETTNQARREIISDFTGISNSFTVNRIEMVMFNCPEWGIAVQTIRLRTANSTAGTRTVDQTINVPTITSCDSLVRIMHIMVHCTTSGCSGIHPSPRLQLDTPC